MAARKKVSPKKTTKKRVSQPLKKETKVMSAEVMTSEVSSPKKGVSTKTKLAILLAVVVIAVVLYVSKGLFVAAVVNGQFVSRVSIVQDLEKRYGKQTVEAMITEMLINQEAKKNNIVVSSQELDDEIKKIEENLKGQGQDLNNILAMQGMSKEELNKQVRVQKLVEKILAEKVKPSDQEVDEYIKTNKDVLPKDKKPEEIRDQVKDQLQQQKLSTEFQTWIAQVKKDAKVQYYVSY